MSLPARAPAVEIHQSTELHVGHWRIDVVNGGRFSLDGGVLFGVVPRRLWEMVQAPDEFNRLPCICNCLLLRDGTHTILIDTGYGGKRSPLDRKFYSLEAGEPILESLAALGVAPEDIDTVVLTHLHWDHAGGLTRRGPGNQLSVTFPNARHVIGRWEWDDARSNRPELAGAYAPENIEPLLDRVELDLVDDNELIVPGLRAQLTGGHTRGHFAIVLDSCGEAALAMSDICPTSFHLRRLWNLAYDLYPVDVRRQKPRLLGQAADENWIVLWSHDPRFVASRLARDPKREFVVTENWSAQ